MLPSASIMAPRCYCGQGIVKCPLPLQDGLVTALEASRRGRPRVASWLWYTTPQSGARHSAVVPHMSVSTIHTFRVPSSRVLQACEQPIDGLAHQCDPARVRRSRQLI